MLHFNITKGSHQRVCGLRELDIEADYEHDLRQLRSIIPPPMPGQRLGGIGLHRTEAGQPRFSEVNGAYLFDTYITTYTYVDGQYSFALIVGLSLSEAFNVADTGLYSVTYAVALAEVVNMADTLALYRAMPVALSESVSVANTYAFQGVYGLILSEALVLGDTISTNAALVAYVVNLNTAAVTTYDNYNFNSFAEMDGKFYGMSDDGLYELTGGTDNGTNIEASIKLGTSDLSTDTVASELLKRLPAVYLGCSVEGDLLLRVTANGTTNSYTLKDANTNSLHTGRMLLGKGVLARYWDFELVNVNGADFTLESMTLLPQAVVRRIVRGG